MKDNRNCNQGYPVYQPMMVPPMGYPVNYFDGMYQSGNSNNDFSNEINNLRNKINNLENRVSRLESMSNTTTNNTTNYNKYTDSNYYMV